MLNLLKIAEKYHLPIISDEIYENIIFEGYKFYSISELSENVPILIVGGIAKAFIVPGWRLGWIIVHDRNNLMNEVIK